MAGSIIGAVAGGLVNKAFGDKASGAMQAGADQAAATQKYMYDTTRKDLEPFRKSGTQALNMLSYLMGLGETRKDIENRLKDQYTRGGSGSGSAASGGGSSTVKSLRELASAPVGTRFDAGNNMYYLKTPWGNVSVRNDKVVNTAGARNPQADRYGQRETRRLAEMYAISQLGGARGTGAAGTTDWNALNAAIDAELAKQNTDPKFGSLAKKFGMSDFETEPGYQFRLSEGQKALDRAQLARGGFLSGAAMKAAQDYGQNIASDEYGKVYGRFRDYQDSLYNKLAGMSNQGMGAVNSGAQNNQNYANQMGNIYGQAANARAAQYVNQGNQFSQSLGSLFGGSQYGNSSTGGAYGGGYSTLPNYGRIDWFK